MTVFKKPYILSAILTVLMLGLQVSAQPIFTSYTFVSGSNTFGESCISNVSANFSATGRSVEAISDNGLSNVLLQFFDGTEQKFEINDGADQVSLTFSGTGANAGKELMGVWITSGCFKCGDDDDSSSDDDSTSDDDYCGTGEYFEYVTQEQP